MVGGDFFQNDTEKNISKLDIVFVNAHLVGAFDIHIKKKILPSETNP